MIPSIAEETWPLIPQGGAVHRFILETFAKTGRSPALEDVRSRFDLESAQDAEALLADLERRGSIHRNAGDPFITHAYPFSNEPTQHRVRLEGGPEVYAMCAIDALGMPFMLKQDAEIASACEQCGGDIELRISNGEITRKAPGEIVVWYGVAGEGCVVATDLCPDLNFFCSSEHLEMWTKERPSRAGDMLTLDQALERGRQSFEKLMQDPIGL